MNLRRLIFYFFLAAFLLFAIACTYNSTSDLTNESIIPKPVSVIASGNIFTLSEDTRIYINHSELNAIGTYLKERLTPATGFDLNVDVTNSIPAKGIYLRLVDTNISSGGEGYNLLITNNLVILTGRTPAGLFNGIQTLRQILPSKIEASTVQAGPWEIPTGAIADYPAYAWRGSMLDVARHFFSVEDVKRYIDLISYYKINILHLHLSDDQGWRIEIKSWPRLTSIGGSTEVGGGKGGFYTQEQYKEIVAYAQSRFITIIPEIDLPGHINSALASYGELNGGTIVPEEGRVAIATNPALLGGKTKPTELYAGIEVGWSTLRAEKEVTFKFVEDVIREISAITPGLYFHIGGDEAAATRKQDYITFINRFKEIVRKNNKIMIGWEEIAQANLDSTDITQWWKSYDFAALAVSKGSKLIMSPSKQAYLDMSYDSTTALGLHWAAYIEVDSAYRWSLSTEIKDIGKEKILGIEAPLWSETIHTMDEIEFLAFPRLPGYAEIGWSPEGNRSWDEYKVRLGKHGERMKAMGVDFYRSKNVEWAK